MLFHDVEMPPLEPLLQLMETHVPHTDGFHEDVAQLVVERLFNCLPLLVALLREGQCQVLLNDRATIAYDVARQRIENAVGHDVKDTQGQA